MDKKKKDTIFIVAGILIAILGITGAVIAVTQMIGKPPKDTTVTSYTTYTPTKVTAPSQSSNGKQYKMKDLDLILVLGTDDSKDSGDSKYYVNYSQADVIYLYAIDHKNKTYQAIQINRDTMADVQTYTMEGQMSAVEKLQICLAHSYGKTDKERCKNTADAVSALLFDVPIKHYISLKMSAIPVLNEQVGGVTVTVPAGLEKADPTFKEGAQVTLKGDLAEKFVRSRSELTDNSNIFRMHRQEIFLKAWKQQAKSKLDSDSGFAVSTVLALADYMYSDMSANKLSDLAAQIKDYKDLGTLTTTGKTIEEGEGTPFREFHVDKDDLKRKVIELCYEET